MGSMNLQVSVNKNTKQILNMSKFFRLCDSDKKKFWAISLLNWAMTANKC